MGATRTSRPRADAPARHAVDRADMDCPVRLKGDIVVLDGLLEVALPVLAGASAEGRLAKGKRHGIGFAGTGDHKGFCS